MIDTQRVIKLQFVVDKPGFAPDTFEVVDFTGEEHVSQPFRFEVNVVSNEPDLTLSDVVNYPATLEVYRGDEQLIFHGMVTQFDQGRHIDSNYYYQIVLRPQLWFLSLNYQSRIFRDKSVPEIIEQVLQEAGFSSQQYKLDLQETYPTWELLVQYEETDLQLVSRLAEYVGIRYFFEDDHVVFTDKPPGTAPFVDGEVLVYNPGGGLEAEKEFIRHFSCREQVVTGKVRMHDWNYRTPTTNLLSESQLNTEMPGVRYEFGHFWDQTAGDFLAKVRNEEIESRRQIMWGTSSYVGISAGFKFTMEEHYRDSLNGDYLFISVQHEGSQSGSLGLEVKGSEGVNVYENRFECLPIEVMYRPQRLTPLPRIPGVLTGLIESTGGDYAHLDEDGRYRARLFFDLGDANAAEATHPIRMNQHYSGPDYGSHFPNHENTEIMVTFLNGDVNRPVALGTVPNPENKAPVVADNKWQNILRTWAGNQLIMDDKKDEEWIKLNTPAANLVLLNDKEDHILISTTNQHQVLLDDQNKHITVQTTDGHFLKMDDENRKITLQSTDGHRMSINDKDELMTIIDASEKHRFEIDIGNEKLTIKTETGDIDILAEQGHIEIRARTLHTETTGDTTHKAANIHAEADLDFTVEATNVSSEATMNHDSKGLNVTSKADLKHEVSGASVDAKASLVHTIQGLPVKIN